MWNPYGKILKPITASFFFCVSTHADRCSHPHPLSRAHSQTQVHSQKPPSFANRSSPFERNHSEIHLCIPPLRLQRCTLSLPLSHTHTHTKTHLETPTRWNTHIRAAGMLQLHYFSEVAFQFHGWCLRECVRLCVCVCVCDCVILLWVGGTWQTDCDINHL